MATGMIFRKASETLELLPDMSLSHQTVHRITQEVDEKNAQTTVSEPRTLSKPRVLYIEGNGVWVGRHRQFEYCLDSYHVMHQITGKLGFSKSLQTGLGRPLRLMMLTLLGSR